MRQLLERRPDLPFVELCELPTPVRELPGLHERLWVKDDGLSAPRWGGNKPRKLEWILGDAKRRRKRTIVTFGGIGTNHGLATAIYAGEAGLDTTLFLVDQPLDEHVEAQLERIRRSGAEVHVTHTTPRTAVAAAWFMARRRGTYYLPPGGSSPAGTLGFVEAGLELAAQVERGELPEPATVWCALGSGGTAAGLLVGLRLAGLETRVRAVLVNDRLRLTEPVLLRLARRTARQIGADPSLTGLDVVHGYLGAGYGHATPEAVDAVCRAREAANLGLDPVYTGKTMAALLDRIPAEEGPALYWHTYSATGHD